MRVVTYLMSGNGYLPYLTASLYTLRKHYSGVVQVEAYEDSYEIVRRIAEDPRLGIEVRNQPWEPEEGYRSKNSQFMNKIKVCQGDDCSSRVYLDADTTVHGPIEPLFELAESMGFCATRFNMWTTQSRVIRHRVEALLKFEELQPYKWAINQVLCNPYPSPNGGILSCVPDSLVLPLWFKLSWASKATFICDEAVLHILQVLFDKKAFVVEDTGRYNSSHKWRDQVDDPVIFHYHGNSCTRPDKSKDAADFWWPIYEECLDQNIGWIQDWRSSIQNKWMLKLKSDPRYAHLI